MVNHISVMNYVESQMLVVKSKLNRYMLQTFEFFLVFISNNLANPAFQFVQNTFARMY